MATAWLMALLAAQGGPAPWFVCDALAGPDAAVFGPVTAGTSEVTLLDRGTGRMETRRYGVGAADHGAGNVWWPLTRDGRAAGAVRGINPGMVAGGADGLPPIKQVRLGARTLDCRWLGHMRFLGVAARRSVAVTREHGQFVYRSFDRATPGRMLALDEGQSSTTPTLEIRGGAALPGGGYRFANCGYRYDVRPDAVTVVRSGRRIGHDRFRFAARRP